MNDTGDRNFVRHKARNRFPWICGVISNDGHATIRIDSGDPVGDWNQNPIDSVTALR